MSKLAIVAAIVGAGLLSATAAQATLSGGPVPTTTFGGSTVYTYQGPTAPAFGGTGGGTLQLSVADYGDSFGTSRTDGTGQAIVFSSATDPVGTTRTIAPGYSPFLFFFHSNGTDQTASCVPGALTDCAATLFTNGATAGAAGGNDGGQANLAVYYAASTNTYAFFFDDGGGPAPAGSTVNDDNDYNDLVVTFTPAATTVPEPVSLALLGSGLLALGAIRRPKVL